MGMPHRHSLVGFAVEPTSNESSGEARNKLLDEDNSPPPSAVGMAPVVAVVPGYSFEVGARYWYSTGKLAKNLYDDPRFSNDLVSRLTYSGLTAHSFEAFGKVNLPSSLFVKGYAGFSGLRNGSLNDEDFPPAIQP